MFSKLFVKCPQCKTNHFISFLKHAFYVCAKCGFQFRLDAITWIKRICDRDTMVEIDTEIKSSDPLDFPLYREKLETAMKATSLNEAVITGVCEINGSPTTLAVMDPRFIMASMGSVVGEKITRMLEYAVRHQLPAVIIISSGGARMQEGILSLMQMAKTAAAVQLLHENRLSLITVLTNPTTGGVTASFAMLGDIIIGETGALIGFAGPRVIQQTIGQTLPPGFQTAEFLLEHGMLDMVLPRKLFKVVLGTLLRLHRHRPYPKKEA